MFLNISQFNNTAVEIAKAEENLRALSDPQELQLCWQELHDYFWNQSPAVDQKYFFSLFRWYTELTWKMLANLPHDIVVDVVCARQIPAAFLLDFDVHKILLDYLSLRTLDEADMMSLYSDMQTSFLASPAVLGVNSGKSITVAEAVEMIKLMQRPSATTIEVAETFGAIQTALFSKTNDLFETYFYAAPDTAVDRFVDLVNFFIGVKPDKIWYVVDAYMHPDRYQEEPAKKENKENLETASPSISEKPSYAEIKQTIESSFSKDASGQFLDQAAVLDMLGTMAAEYNDQQILDLYYYNEADGQFYWNEELLNR